MKSKIVNQDPIIVLEVTVEEAMIIQRALSCCLYKGEDSLKPTYGQLQPIYNNIGYITNEYRKIPKEGL